MNKLLVCSLIILSFFVFTGTVLAKIGVGVNTGRIRVDEQLKAGIIYQLPSITVINTGDTASEYQTTIAYHQDQPELKPETNWFIFSPQRFHLEPGEAQAVDIKINLPIKIEPGDYFAYLEAQPVATVQKGTTTLGVAAASKLYFTVTPANILLAVYYKVVSFFQVYAPYPQAAVIILLVTSALMLFKKFFNIQINVKPASKNQND